MHDFNQTHLLKHTNYNKFDHGILIKVIIKKLSKSFFVYTILFFGFRLKY